jgi:hypothetical protein
MKSDQPNVKIEQASREDQLLELAVRVLADIARIVAAEARMLESNIIGAAHSLLDRVFLTSTIVVLAAAGVLALLASLILLLRLLMPMWLALGLVGVFATVAAEALRRVLITTLYRNIT